MMTTIDEANLNRYLENIRLKDDERWIFGSVHLTSHGLTDLPFKDVNVSGEFSVRFNRLVTLEGSPKTVRYHFKCCANAIKDLEGSPEKIGGDFYCLRSPNLKTLKGIGQVDGLIYLNEPLVDDDYFLELVLMDKIRLI